MEQSPRQQYKLEYGLARQAWQEYGWQLKEFADRLGRFDQDLNPLSDGVVRAAWWSYRETLTMERIPDDAHNRRCRALLMTMRVSKRYAEQGGDFGLAHAARDKEYVKDTLKKFPHISYFLRVAIMHELRKLDGIMRDVELARESRFCWDELEIIDGQ